MNLQSPFDIFGLPKPLLEALMIMRYQTPTPIQEKTIPIIKEGKDLIGLAQTGTGKTAAYGIPLVASLIQNKDAQGLILVPTRELATQVYEVMRQLTQNVKFIKPWVIIGGTSMYAQAKSLPKYPRLLIATPGRLMDHLDRRTFSIANVKTVVLDEADRMLDIGFEPQIRKIFHFVPKQRQTLLFSATFPKTVDRLTREYMSHPLKITIGKISEPGKDIQQSFVQTTALEKNKLLVQELNTRQGSVLVFVRTKHKVDKIARMLVQEGFQADRIHGERTQGQRTRVMQDFRSMKIRILVATDVASRGLDIPHIEHVINFDLPEVPEDYIHRIGRTARAGAKGESISFMTSEDRAKWAALSRHLNALGMKVDPQMIKNPVGQNSSAPSIGDKKETNRYDGEHRRSHGRPKFRPAKSKFQSRSSSDRPSSGHGSRTSDRSSSSHGSHRTGERTSGYGPRKMNDRPSPGHGSRTSDRPSSGHGPQRSDSRSTAGHTPPKRTDGPRGNFLARKRQRHASQQQAQGPRSPRH